jgi:hypothetical protein
VNDAVLKAREATYRLLVDLGRAPSAEEVARDVGISPGTVRSRWRELHDAHALVLDPGGREIRMAHPFSAVATDYRVEAAGRWWYANCAWDAFGICAALGTDGRIACTCQDCDEPIAIAVRDRRPSDDSLLFHCLVPARHWWDDIAFT